jgi:chemotaxis protein MotA
MDISTLVGIIIGAIFILAGIIMDGNVTDYYSLSSIMITIGGTIASTIAHYPLEQIKNIFKIGKNAFIRKEYDLSETIGRILELANMARREGLLSLDNVAEEIEEPFLKKGIMLIVDGTDPELVKSIMETELVFMEERHTRGQAIFQSLGEYAPAYGMIGTLIGLINMLKNLESTETLGMGMATALITTFYGIILANLVFYPIVGKLQSNSIKEINYNELILEGLLSIQAGENPRIVEEKLTSFIANTQKRGEREATSINKEEAVNA